MRNMLKGMLNDIGGEDLFDGIIKILTKDPFTEYGVENVVTSLYNAVMAAAMMLMFIYFLISVVDKMTSENFTWEQLWKQMAMLLAAKMVIEHGLEIMMLMSKVGVEIVGLVQAEGLGEMRGGIDVSSLMVALYISSVPGIICTLSLLKLLFNIRKNDIFTKQNVIILQILSYCCLFVGIEYVAICYSRYISMIFVGFAAIFIGIILRVIKNVFDKAIEIREENDYTI